MILEEMAKQLNNKPFTGEQHERWMVLSRERRDKNEQLDMIASYNEVKRKLTNQMLDNAWFTRK